MVDWQENGTCTFLSGKPNDREDVQGENLCSQNNLPPYVLCWHKILSVPTESLIFEYMQKFAFPKTIAHRPQVD